MRIVRLQAVLLLLLGLVHTSAFAQFTPPNIAGLSLWLRADSGLTQSAGLVTQWNDVSGNSVNAAPPTSSNDPSLIYAPELDSFPSLRFNGSTSYLQSALPINNYNTASLTVFILAKGYSQPASTGAGLLNVGDVNNIGLWMQRNLVAGTESFRVYNGSGAGYIEAFDSMPLAGFPYKIFDFDKVAGASTAIDVNGAQCASSNSSSVYASFVNAPYVVGYSSGNYYLNGEIAEIIVYTTALTTNQKQQVVTYLENKYAPPVSLGPDINSTYSLCKVVLRPGNRFTNYSWSNGATSDTLLVTQSGTYSVTVTDVFHRVSSDTINVTVPQLSLNVPDTAVCAGHPVLIGTTLASTTYYTFLWDSGATSATFSPTVSGNYYVTVRDTFGCTQNTDTIAVNIDNFGSTVSMLSSQALCAGNPISLLTPSSGWGSLQFHWSTGSTASTIPATTAGTYSVTVTDASGCSGSASTSVSISGTAPNISFSGDTFCQGAVYNPQNTTDTSQHVTSYVWTFGDGNNATGFNPTHLYTQGGAYTVTLVATNNLGCVSTLTQPVLVNDIPVDSFYDGDACNNSPHQFVNLSTAFAGDSLYYQWSFGAGLPTSTLRNPSYTYTAAGTYSVTLFDSTNFGCSATITQNVVVLGSANLPPAVSLIEPANGTALAPGNITFVWSASAGVSYYTLIVSTDPNFITGNNTYTGTATQASFNLSAGTYYWQVQALNTCGQAVPAAIDSFSIFSPPNFPGLALWLRGDSGLVLSGNNVTQWSDVSPNQDNALPPLPANEPTVVNPHEINSLPSISFNGTSSYLQSVAAIPGYGTSSLTVFILTKGYSQAAAFGAGFFNVGGVNNIGLWLQRNLQAGTESFRMVSSAGFPLEIPMATPLAGFPYKILGFEKDSGVSVGLDTNGVKTDSSSFSGLYGSFPNAQYVIGNSNTFSYLNGEIAEIIVYTQYLSPAQKQEVINYLYNKYAPPVNLGPDIVEAYSLCPLTLDAGNRFITYNWSDGSTGETLVATQTGTYSVTVTDVFHRTSSSTVHVTLPVITLNQPPQVSFCPGSSLPIGTNIANPTGYTFNWSNGASTPTINASTAGNYFVQVTDSSGCSQTTNTINLVQDNFNSTVSMLASANLCTGNSISLQAPTTGWDRLQFIWSTGSTDSVVTITTSMNYCLTVTDTSGCSATACTNVTVVGTAPTVDFSNDTMCFNTPFTPSNNSVPAGNFSWTFGDGGTSTLQSPSHTYGTTGTFAVTLTDVANGCSNSITKGVLVETLPVPSFTGAPSCANNSFQFTDLSTAPAGDSIVSWNWNFGDGGTSNQQNPVHDYPAAGTYNVSLTVVDGAGCAGSITISTNVTNLAGLSPVWLVVPPNNAAVTDGNIIFAWNSVPGALSYTLIVSTDPNFVNNDSIYANLSTNQHSVFNLPGPGTYYWEVKAYDACANFSTSTSYTFSIFNPSVLSCLTLWLKADSGAVDSSNLVTMWKDMSGNNYNTTGPARADSMPTFIPSVPLLNNKPSIYFNGTTNEFYGDTIVGINTSSLTAFIIAKGDYMAPAPTTYTAGLFTIGGQYTGMWIYDRVQYDDFAFINNWNSGADAIISIDPNSMPNTGYPYAMWEVEKKYTQSLGLYKNGSLDSIINDAGTSGGFTNDKYFIGHTFPPFVVGGFDNLHGEIAEIILYNCALSDPDRQLVENYIYNKYAPPVYLGPDIEQSTRVCPATLDAGNRFVSYLWSTGDTVSSIVVKQSGIYWVSVVDVFGHSSTDTINVTLPYLGVSPTTDTTLCLGKSFTITQLLNNPGGFTYAWNNGISSITNQATVNSPGIYLCTITDGSGCSIVSDTVRVKVDSFSLVQIVPTDTLICGGSPVALNVSGYQPVSYLWSPGGNTTAVFVITTGGTYSVTVTDINGCVAHGSTNVTVHGQAPTANFSVANLCLGSNSNFTDLSQTANFDFISAYFWNFGGGTPPTSTIQDPTTVYNAFGNFEVTLFITTDSGCTASKTDTIYINPTPRAGFTYSGSNSSITSSTILCAGTDVLFTDTSIAVGGDSISTVLWDINGTTSSTANILYAFQTQGTYNVSLTVTNDSGCVDNISEQVQVFAPFIADFTYTNACLGDSTYFMDATQSFSIISWQWTFGDLFTSSLQNPVHLYESASPYTATLSIVNAIGCTANVSKIVNIVEPPIADFSDSVGCSQHEYTPLDNSIALGDTITQWRWDINGTEFFKRAPQYFFTDTGIFNVSLVVTTNQGCTDSISKPVHIIPNPVAIFTYTPLFGSAPLDVTFIGLAKYANAYLWNFGDGGIANTDTAEHTYSQNGDYNVVFYASNSYGCIDSALVTFAVIPTDLDIALDAVSAIQIPQSDGTTLVQTVVQASNLGTRLISSCQFKVILGSGGVLVDNWEGQLNTGQSMIDTLAAEFDVAPDNANSFICVIAQDVNNGQTEVRVDNNEACASISGAFVLTGPSPSPASSQSILGIFMPGKGTVTISIYNELGQFIVNQQSLDLPAGKTDYMIPVQKMPFGEYYIKVTYDNISQVRKLIAH